jgi:putative intracellular protease/amidase
LHPPCPRTAFIPAINGGAFCGLFVKGRKVTSVSSIKDDLVNAWADWFDEEVVVDGKLITSRKPDDLPAFMSAVIREA